MPRSSKRKDTTVAEEPVAPSKRSKKVVADAAAALVEDAAAVEGDSNAAAATATPAAPSEDNETDGARYTSLGKPPMETTDPANFDHFLFQLLSFKADTNNYHVPKELHPDLHAWLQHLKREYKAHAADEGGDNNYDDEEQPAKQEAAKAAEQPEGKQEAAEAAATGTTTPHVCSLTAEQLKVLQSLHVPLTSRGDDHWNRFYQLLCDYKERHTHVLVPRLCETPGLGDWVTDQRRQYKAWKQGSSSQLTAERRQKLVDLGFVWQVRNRPEWDQRYQELQVYKEKNGDCKVPQHYKSNKALGKWVAKQREQYKLYKKGQHSFLTPYRMERLNAVGFVWQVRTATDTDDVSEADGTDAGDAGTPATAAETPADETIKVEKAAASVEEAAAAEGDAVDVAHV